MGSLRFSGGHLGVGETATYRPVEWHELLAIISRGMQS